MPVATNISREYISDRLSAPLAGANGPVFQPEQQDGVAVEYHRKSPPSTNAGVSALGRIAMNAGE